MITISLYGKVSEFKTRDEAKEFLLDCMMNSDGAERDRYTDVYIELLHGKTEITDGDPVRPE
jgi:hypothetical protein